jgi:hypothetical protein
VGSGQWAAGSVHPVIAYFWLCRGRGFPLPNVHGWRRLATINQPPCRGELLHSCSSAHLQDMACTTDMAPEQEDPMHSSLHSCTFGQKAPRRSLASLEDRGAAKPLTQVRKILMNRGTLGHSANSPRQLQSPEHPTTFFHSNRNLLACKYPRRSRRDPVEALGDRSGDVGPGEGIQHQAAFAGQQLMKNSGSAALERAGWILMPVSLQRSVYRAALQPERSKSVGSQPRNTGSFAACPRLPALCLRAAIAFSAARQRRSSAANSTGSTTGTSSNSCRVGPSIFFDTFFFMSHFPLPQGTAALL